MRSMHALVLVAAAAALTACEQDAPRGDPLKGGSASGAPAMQPGMGEMPPGHPPMLPDAHPPVAGGPKPNAVKPVPFEWETPAGWTEVAPASALRFAQLDLPGKWPDGGAVSCAFFGAIGGGKQANIDRWIGQFTMKDGSSAKDKAKITESKTGDLTVTRIELVGAFADGMQRPPRQADDGMLLGAIIESAGGESLYIKLAGPRSAIEPEAAKFDAMLASFTKK